MTRVKRSTFSVLFYLKKNEPKANGNVPIMARITVDGEHTALGTKLDLPPQLNWNLKYNRVLGKTNEAITLNNKLEGIQLRVRQIYDELIKDAGFATAVKVKLTFLGIDVMANTLLKAMDDHNEEFKKLVDNKQRAYSTYRKYCYVRTHVSEFIKLRHHREDMSFRELTPYFIKEFDFFLRYDKGYSHNTVWVYTIPLIAQANLAVKHKLIKDNPFEDYENSMEELDRSYLLKGDVEKVMLLKPSKPRYELVKDLFIFSCFTGLSYIDIKNLKWSNIQSFFDGHQWIISRRQKSDATSNVRLMDIPKYIIEKYRGTTEDNHVFPVPCNGTCNSHVKILMEQAGIVKDNKVTFHTARHTFATMMLTEGVSLESISKMLGHRKITTTQIYAKITDEKISKEMDLISSKFAAMESQFIIRQATKCLEIKAFAEFEYEFGLYLEELFVLEPDNDIVLEVDDLELVA